MRVQTTKHLATCRICVYVTMRILIVRSDRSERYIENRWMGVGFIIAQRFLHSQVYRETRNAKHADCPFKRRDAKPVFPPRELGIGGDL